MTQQNSALATRRKGERICPQCGIAFVCGMAAGENNCWCADLPALMPLPGAESGCGCYCPDCLRKLIETRGG